MNIIRMRCVNVWMTGVFACKSVLLHNWRTRTIVYILALTSFASEGAQTSSRRDCLQKAAVPLRMSAVGPKDTRWQEDVRKRELQHTLMQWHYYSCLRSTLSRAHVFTDGNHRTFTCAHKIHADSFHTHRCDSTHLANTHIHAHARQIHGTQIRHTRPTNARTTSRQTHRERDM